MKFYLSILVFLFSFGVYAEFNSQLEVYKIKNSKKNKIATGEGTYIDCVDSFKGTYEGNTVYLQAKVLGDDKGKYKHRIVYHFGASYDEYRGEIKQFDIALKASGKYELELPDLRDGVPFVQQSVFLVSENIDTGITKTSSLMFSVSRPVYLSRDYGLDHKESCRQVFPANEAVTGILSNGTTNLAGLTINQGVQNIWDNTSGYQYGFYFSPLAWLDIANVFTFHWGYFKQFSRKTIETVEISNNYQVSPGDYYQVYKQLTRYVTPFKATQISSCGESSRLTGLYYAQWWGVAYHAVPINPFEPEAIDIELVGVRPSNTCTEDLTPEFAGLDSKNFTFVRTNLE